jgi:HEAT repeat protein
MNARKNFAITIILALISVSACAAVGDTGAKVDEILQKMPAGKPSEVYESARQLAALGGDGVKAICGMLVEQGTGDDTKARYALDALAVYVGRTGAEGERRMYVRAIADGLGEAKSKEVKAFLIKRLEMTGEDESVGVVSGYLGDERLCEPAAQALTIIATESAKKSLADALPSAKGGNVVTLVTALGNLRCEAVADRLVKYAGSDDTTLRRAALRAIANIAAPSAEAVLAKAAQAKGSYERAKATSFYLLYASRIAADGDKGKSTAICRELVSTRKGEDHVQCAALSIIVDNLGGDAQGDLLAAVDSDNAKLRAGALMLAEKIDGRQATEKWLAKMDSCDATRKAEIIAMLADRGDKTAAGRMVDVMKGDSDKGVRMAAVAAAVRLGGDSVTGQVLGFVKAGASEEETVAAVKELARLKGAAVPEAMAGALPSMPSRAKAAIVESLASRKAKGQSGAVFACVDDSDSGVRSAAIKALVDVAGTGDIDRLIAILGSTQGVADRTNAQRAIVAAAEQIADRNERGAKVLAAMQGASGDKRVALIQVLGKIGGTDALAAVTRDASSDDASVKDAAVRSLAGWPEPDAAGALLDIVSRTDNTTHRVVALRGLVRLLGAEQVKPTIATQMYALALKAVDRADDRKLIIAGLSGVRSIEALRLVAGYLNDETLKSEAAMAVVKIACSQGNGDKGLEEYESVVIVRRALSSITDEKARQQAEAHIKSIQPSSKAEIKPVPEGFVPLFNGVDLTGWKGLLHSPYDNPAKRATLTAEKYAELQAKEDESMREHWTVKDGVLYFDGSGFSLATAKQYGDCEMLVDWKVVHARGDSGIYLRGSPQVQIWDPQQHKIGSGGLYNNKKGPANPTKIADNPIGTWNTFRIIMIGEKVTVYLNGELVVDNVVLENYWDRGIPIFDREQIELQCHGNPIEFTNIFIREIPREGEFTVLFNGRDLAGWVGDTKGYQVQDGTIVCKPGGNLYTYRQYGDFHFKFDFKLTPNANNGLGIRAEFGKDAAYNGMELQILDDTGSQYTKLEPYQYHGSIYGIVPAKRGHLKPVGEWNHHEVIAKGPKIKVILNDTVIVDADLVEAVKNYKPELMHDPSRHPGLMNKEGYIGFLGHGSVLWFKNIEIMELD